MSGHPEEEDMEDGEQILCAMAAKREPVNRDLIDVKKPKLYQLMFAFTGIATYIGTYIIDAMVLRDYYLTSQWLWFGFTLMCFIIPTIVIQMLSLKWFHDDSSKFDRLKFRTVIMHFLCLGPVERYCNIIYYGYMTRQEIKNQAVEPDIVNLVNYLENWRDVSMLRFFYGFLETGPQVTLQLYVLMDYISRGVVAKHVFTVIKIIVAFGGLSIGMVLYNSDLRDTEGKGLSCKGILFQAMYRLLMITTRIATLVLFTIEFKWYVLAVLIPTWLLMVVWVWRGDSVFFTKGNGTCNKIFETIFQVIMGYIYIFCYVATEDGSQAKPMTIYYIIFYLENIGMMVLWVVLDKKNSDSFKTSAISIVLCLMFFGIIFLVVYYKYAHPNLKRKDKGNALDEEDVPCKMSKQKKSFFERVNEVQLREQLLLG